MGFNKIVRSRGFRNMMSKLYGWGAALVILGALFKINHYPGADIMLAVGLGTEALIFFFSAFEPPHVEPDWSLVYPQLSHMYHGGAIAAGAGVVRHFQVPGSSPTQELDKMLSDAKVGPELIQSLGDGLRRLSESTSKLSNLGTAAVASEEFVSSMKNAAVNVERLAASSKKQSDLLEQESQATTDLVDTVRSVSQKAAELGSTYTQASQAIRADVNATATFTEAVKNAANSANDLAARYSKSAEQISKSSEMLDMSKLDSDALNQQLIKITGSLSSLNTMYELQLQHLQHQVESGGKLSASVNHYMSNMSQTSENMNKYKEELDSLTRRIAALNSVYGNMLAAMNVSAK